MAWEYVSDITEFGMIMIMSIIWFALALSPGETVIWMDVGIKLYILQRLAYFLTLDAKPSAKNFHSQS